ncbi:MAG: hypothetical protein ACLFT3_11980 [Cyclobacteriaceae bacterium]
MKHIFILIFVLPLSLFFSCSEEDEAIVSAPKLEERGILADRVTFAYTIEEKDAQGTLHCLLQKSEESQPDGKQIMESPFTLAIQLKGRTFSTASFPGLTAKTNYTIYGLVELNGHTSSISRLTFTTP